MNTDDILLRFGYPFDQPFVLIVKFLLRLLRLIVVRVSDLRSILVLSLCIGLILRSFTLVAFLTMTTLCLVCGFIVTIALLVEVIVIVPSLRTAWIVLGEYKHEIVGSQLDALVWVRDDILDLFLLLLIMIFRSTLSLMLIIFFIFELVVVHHLSPVQSNWNHVSSSCQVVEQV